MNQTEAIEISREAVLTMLLVGGPIMATALLVGLAIALFQALTSIQEMTLTFVPKIIVIFVTTILLLPYMLAQLSGFTVELMDRIIALG